MNDMYGIVICKKCERKRIADLSAETTACPYCSAVSHIDKMTILFTDADQSAVREVFENIDSSKYPEPRKKSTNDPDPLSTLVYEYEHTTGNAEKLIVLAEGLTKIKGTFTQDDIEELFPGEGKKMMKMMISGDIIIETEYERYKAV
ncbi:MAG: hypothetical protein FWH44_00560 [Methanomassiliicoccaceae archaeon]|nr:hypothetical protein [Methanomassiliicoccaceae archaeon]